jgi:hypothetical protein
MNPIKGHYSIVQYCPDITRREMVNIGVVLLVPERAKKCVNGKCPMSTRAVCREKPLTTLSARSHAIHLDCSDILGRVKRTLQCRVT